MLDFLDRVKIDPSDVRILIKGGAFDELEKSRSRPELMWQLQWWQSQRYKNIKSGLPTLFDRHETMPVNMPKSANYDDHTILKQEVETLGFLISRHPLMLYEDKMKKLPFIRAIDLEKHVNKYVTTIGWLITRKLAETKTGQMMEFMSFEDTTAIYETTFFPNTYNKFVHMMTFTRPYVLYGKVDSQYDAVTFNVIKVNFL